MSICRKSVAVVLLGVFGFFSEANSQEATINCGDCLAPDPVEKAFSETTGVVFHGLVTGIRSINLGDGVRLNAVTFLVLEEFKGSTERIYVSSLCGFPFQLGEEYIVWAEQDYVFTYPSPVSDFSALAYKVVPCSKSSRTAALDSVVASEDLSYLQSLPVCGNVTSQKPCRETNTRAGMALAGASSGVSPISDYNCPLSHPIKGNLTTRGGECIFHEPDSRYYEVTKPEICFATSSEAIEFGCRQPM
jgi:hypothetical protein